MDNRHIFNSINKTWKKIIRTRRTPSFLQQHQPHTKNCYCSTLKISLITPQITGPLELPIETYRTPLPAIKFSCRLTKTKIQLHPSLLKHQWQLQTILKKFLTIFRLSRFLNMMILVRHMTYSKLERVFCSCLKTVMAKNQALNQGPPTLPITTKKA